MDSIDITIIGGGVVGLALAARLAGHGDSLVLLEKNERCGQETSSRNSEVIHAGLYYPPESLKARLCVRGNALLYEYCRKKGINHRRLGKIVISIDSAEEAALEHFFENGKRNGVRLERLSGKRVSELEPDITATAGILSPDTGIFDTHGFMQSLIADAKDGGAVISPGAEAVALEKEGEGYTVRVKPDDYCFTTKILINCAGLQAHNITALAGIDTAAAGYRIYYCKGNYFRTRQQFNITRLVYPVPDPQIHGLGIHLTPDLAGAMRLGPDAHYVDYSGAPEQKIDHSVDEFRRAEFAAAVQRYLPSLDEASLDPDTAGIRPKLQGPGGPWRDFVITHEKKRGLDGLINLVGIDSPGLTSSLAIAEHVAQLIASLDS